LRSQSAIDPNLSLPMPDHMPTNVAPEVGRAKIPTTGTGPNPGSPAESDKLESGAALKGHRPDPGISGTESNKPDPGTPPDLPPSSDAGSSDAGAPAKTPTPEPEVVPVMPGGTPSVYMRAGGPTTASQSPQISGDQVH
jgi:hypothetical protein